MKIQTKTAILFTLITAALLGIISTASYILTTNFVSNDFLKRLELRAVVASKVFFEQDHTSTNTYEELRKKHLEFLPQEKEYIIRKDTIKRASSFLPLSYLEEIGSSDNTVYYHSGKTDYAGILYKDETADYLVIKSAVNEYGISTLAKLKGFKIICFIVGLILVYTISVFFAKKTFQPVRAIIKKSKEIGAHNLNLRLAQPKGQDEIAELTSTFNNMLDRLQTSFETQNNFISNASHELRTPLTSIIGEADLALQKDRDVESYKDSLRRIQEQADHLNAITSTLLTMAQTSFNGRKQSWEKIDLYELLHEASNSISKINTDGHLRIEDDFIKSGNRPVLIIGIKNLLLLALTNIFSNALKYSKGSEVTIVTNTRGNECTVHITDSGIGIPAADLPHIFEPFYRASNSEGYEGFGVGLPLAMNIVRLHNGTIQVSSVENKGTTVSLILPLS